MKIQDPSPSILSMASASRTPKEIAATGPAKPALEVSQPISSKPKAEVVFDSKKVDEIRSAIANGEFRTDASKIADSLIKSAVDFLGGKK